jgi:acyl-homoserine lactone acylase PvdQ
MRRLSPLFALGVLALLPAAAPAASRYDHDYAATARNIIPSGQYGTVPIPAGADTQAKMYDALTPLFDKVTNGALQSDFKSEVFGVGGDGPGKKESVPRKGVTITRDRFDVPHVKATTYDGGIWASGWIAAEDRGLLLQQARYNSRVAVIDAPGLSALDLISSLKTFVPSAQTEAATADETNVLLKAGKKGRQVLHDIDTFATGVNAYFKRHNPTNAPWTRSDTYALEALKGQFVGQGGGDEARRTQFLSSLDGSLGATRGMQVFNDLRQHDDPEQPTSIGGSFPYEPIPTSAAGNVIIDKGSFQSVSSLASGARYVSPPALASNELMVDAKHSATGRPLMVAGPQIGYYYPGLTYEIDMHAPGLVWRGATSAPFPGYMLIGRGPDFAVSLTSADGDIIDQYAETLCGGSDTKYLYKGQCRDMTVFNAGVLKGSNGAPDQTVSFHETVHGPVVGYATVNGTRVAISSKRSSRGKDALDLLLYRDLSTGAVKSPKTFFKAASESPQTFNSFYIDDKHIAEYTSGLLPKRPADVDPGLLTNGNGNYEWKGFISANAHPHQADPKSGYIVNWNNNIAKGFGAADDQWMRAGSVARVDLLNKNLKRLAVKGKQTLATMTSAMNAAATQDVRAVDTLPLLVRILKNAPAPSPRDQQMVDLMTAWADNGKGGSLLDRNLDGKIDAPGAAIVDGIWTKVANAAMAPVLGTNVDELATLVSRHSMDQYTGWYQYFDKDWRRLLGDPEKGPLTAQYCGAGNLTACAASLWAAIDSAGNDLTAKFGTVDPTQWLGDATAQRITFTPGLLTTTMRFTNRPTGIQQVISFRGHR